MFLAWYRRLARVAGLKADETKTERRRQLSRRLCHHLLVERLEERTAPAVTLSLPTTGFTGAQNTTVMNFPININTLTDGTRVGLGATNLAVTFPTGEFSFPVGGGQATTLVSLGSVPISDTTAPGGAADWTLTANSPTDGILNVSMQPKPGLAISTNTGAPGSLVTINFPIRPTAGTGNQTIKVVGANGSVHTQVFSNTTAYTLSPGAPFSGTITVTAGTQMKPTVPATQAYTTESNATLTQAAPGGVLTGASDPQGEPLSVGTVNGSAANVGTAVTLPSGATVTVQSNGSFVYTPARNFVGTDSFTFQAMDTGPAPNNISDPGTVNITMVPTLNQVPAAGTGTTVTGSTVSGSPGGIFTEQVILDNPNQTGTNGMTSFSLAMTYTASTLTISSVTPGPDLPSDWTFTPHTLTSGVIGIGAFGTGSGADIVTGPSPIVLATISFKISSVPSQTVPLEIVPSATTPDGTAVTSVSGASASFALNPPLSNSFITGVDSHIAITSLIIGLGSLPNGDVNAAYNQTIGASGGTGPYTFAITSGALPPSLTLSTGGVFSGTPSVAGTYTFTVMATDSVGKTGSNSYTVNINPIVTMTTMALVNWTVNQPGYSQMISATGGTGMKSFSSSGTLPEGLTLSNSGAISGTPTATGNYTFAVTATDTVGENATQNYAVTINPAVTFITMTLADGTAIVPGYSQTINASGGTGGLTFSSSGMLPPGLALSSSGVLSGTPQVSGSYTFTVTGTDSVGSSGSQSYTVTINPGTPTQLVVSATSTATAGTPFNFTVTAEDGGENTAGAFSATVTLNSTLGADITPTSVALTNGTATIPVTLTTAGIQTITATFPGLTSGTASITVSPGLFSQYLVAVLGSSTVQAGSAILTTVQAADAFGNPITSGYSAPATVTASISPISATSNFPITAAIASSGLGFFNGIIDKVGSYTITTSSSSFTGSTSTPVTVTPAAPSKLAFGTQPVNTPTGVALPTVTAQIWDLFGNVVTSDNTDSVTLAVASGPGSFTVGSTTTATVLNGVASFANLTLVKPGTYTLSAVLPGHFITSSATFSVAPLQVVPGSFVSSPSGFGLQFNTAFLVNSVTPVLYGQGFGAAAPPPSVIVTTDPGNLSDHAGYVQGSLVLSTATNSIAFVATDTANLANSQLNNAINGTPISPLLPDGIYTVIVRSSAATNGFQAQGSGGGFLDGLGSGIPGSGDFVASFSVNAAAANQDVLWVPATADGPGQALSAPGRNQAGGGYPVYLDDSTGTVTNVQVTLNYNPALLSLTGVSGAGFSLLGTSTPGHAVLQYSGPALATGTQTAIGFIAAIVPGGTVSNPTPYKAKDLLHLSNVSLNGSAIPVTTGDALHLVAYVADGDGNGSYSNNDAVLITRAMLGADTGFAAYPLVDPIIVADTDGAGFIPADAPLQANEAGVGFPTANLTVPPVPGGVHFRAIANNVDPRLSLPAILNVGSDATVTVPVNIDDAHPQGSSGLIEAHLALTYDPRQFSVSAADVHLGTLLAASQGWNVLPTINSVTGQIAIALASTTPITTSLGGSLVTIDFHQSGYGEPSGVSRRVSTLGAIALVASVNPTGQQVIATELEDAQGTFTLSPALSNAFNPHIDSVVVLGTPPLAPVSSDVLALTTLAQGADAPRSAGDDSRLVEAHVVETTTDSTAPAVLPEAGDQEGVAGPTASAMPAVIHLSVAAGHGAGAVVTDASSLTATVSLGAVPLAGLLLPLANAHVANAQGSIETASWQHLADQWFQAMARSPGLGEATLRDSSGSETVGRVLTGQRMLPPSASDDLDVVDWQEAGGEVNRPGMAPWNLCGRRDAASRGTSPAAVAPFATERAALDQVFSQATDDTDSIVVED